MSDLTDSNNDPIEERMIIPSRREIDQLLEANHLMGKGVEVGVCDGDYSVHILSTWKGDRLYSVDPWKSFGEEYKDVNNAHQELHDLRYENTKKKLSVFGKRSVVIRKTSLEASVLFGDGALDFVYLDAQHHYSAVKADIEAWYPKVKVGGILGGHDYLDGVLVGGVFGVKRAVQEFAKEQNLDILVSGEMITETASWFLIKK